MNNQRKALPHPPLLPLIISCLFPADHHFDFQATVTYLLDSNPSTACFFQQLMDSEGSALGSFPPLPLYAPLPNRSLPFYPRLQTYILNRLFSHVAFQT